MSVHQLLLGSSLLDVTGHYWFGRNFGCFLSTTETTVLTTLTIFPGKKKAVAVITQQSTWYHVDLNSLWWTQVRKSHR